MRDNLFLLEGVIKFANPIDCLVSGCSEPRGIDERCGVATGTPNPLLDVHLWLLVFGEGDWVVGRKILGKKEGERRKVR
jgi:hypothetical protein